MPALMPAAPLALRSLAKTKCLRVKGKGFSLFERILPHHPNSEKFRELAVNTTVLSVSRSVRSPGRFCYSLFPSSNNGDNLFIRSRADISSANGKSSSFNNTSTLVDSDWVERSLSSENTSLSDRIFPSI